MPRCAASDVSAVMLRMPAVEVYGVVPAAGQDRADYPFKTLFYESSSYQHLKKVHFEDLVPSTMTAACALGAGSTPSTQVMLWNRLYIE